MKARPTVKKPAPRREAQTKPVPTIRNDFTVRDMNRRPQSLLAAAQKLGRVVIRSRSAGNFILTPEVPALNQRIEEAEAFMQRQRAFRARLCRMGFVAPSKEDSEKIARMIAGEEP